jgi:hypothetical protein
MLNLIPYFSQSYINTLCGGVKNGLRGVRGILTEYISTHFSITEETASTQVDLMTERFSEVESHTPLP